MTPEELGYRGTIVPNRGHKVLALPSADLSRSDSFSAYVDALLGNRRPPRFRATLEEARMLSVVVALRSVRPGAELPMAAFLHNLQRRLRSALDTRRAPPD